jgi:hypothetical protein
MAELEAALVELGDAVKRGDVTHEDLEKDLDLQEDVDEDSNESTSDIALVDQGRDSCTYQCVTGYGSNGWYTVPKPNFKPTANGWYVYILPWLIHPFISHLIMSSPLVISPQRCLGRWLAR